MFMKSIIARYCTLKTFRQLSIRISIVFIMINVLHHRLCICVYVGARYTELVTAYYFCRKFMSQMKSTLFREPL